MLKRFYIYLVCGLLVVMTSMTHAFTLKDTQGKTHKLSDYNGKWVLINFWATWCPPCLDEIPDFIKLQETRKDLIVIGIALDYQNPAQVTEFANNMFVNYPIVLGSQKIAAQIGPVPGLPTTYLYNPQGKQATFNVGPVTRESVEEYINSKKPAEAKK